MNTVLNLDKRDIRGGGSRFSEVVSNGRRMHKQVSEKHMQIYVESERSVEAY